MNAASPIRVVLAEDETKLAFAVRTLLELDGRCAVVAVAANGLEAVEAALRLRPDVIVLDIQMPLLDGVAAAERILASWPDARVVIYSGDETELARGRTAGVRAALQKGKLVDALVAAVEGAAAQ